MHNSHLFVNGEGIYKFKASNKNVNFSFQFCLESISSKFDYVFQKKVCNFSVDYNAIDKSDLLDNHKFLMAKNSIK